MPELPADLSRPPLLNGICARALAINPDERYATAGELEIDLRNVMFGAADSHARTLGRVVSNAFTTARAEREAMIARALVNGRAMAARPDWVRDPSWANTIDAFLTKADEVLDVTVVDESIVEEMLLPRHVLPAVAPPAPPPPRRRSRVGIGGAIAGTAAAAAVLGLLAAKAPLSASPPPAAPTAHAAASAEPWTVITPVAAPAVPSSTPVVATSVPSAAPPPSTTSTEPSTLPPSTATRNHFARRAAAARHHGQDESSHFEVGLPTESASTDDTILEKKRPASLRSIDENDPFK